MDEETRERIRAKFPFAIRVSPITEGQYLVISHRFSTKNYDLDYCDANGERIDKPTRQGKARPAGASA